MNSGPTAITNVRKSFESVTTKSAIHRKTTEPMEKTTAASTRSSRNMLASFMMSATCELASSLNLSSRAYGVATVAGSTADGRNVDATPIAREFAVSDTLLM